MASFASHRTSDCSLHRSVGEVMLLFFAIILSIAAAVVELLAGISHADAARTNHWPALIIALLAALFWFGWYFHL